MFKLSLILFISVSFSHGIRGDFLKIQAQRETVSKQLKQSPEESVSKIMISPAGITGGEKFDDNKLREFILDEDGVKGGIENLREKAVIGCNVAPDVEFDSELSCFSCFAKGTSKKDENCFKARKLRVIKCAKKEKCYTEIHPDYLKRGCKMQSLLNRTHVCKCPLCNDKPSNDSSYYDYKKIGHWKYDNQRLEVPLIGLNLFCKICATNGKNRTIDETCKIGTNANTTICEQNQLCYTNVDGKSNDVSRGCMDRPTYNSIYFFCQTSLCNNRTFYNLKSSSREMKSMNIPSNTITNNITSTNNSLNSENLYLPFLRRQKDDIFLRRIDRNKSGIELLDILKKMELKTETPETDDLYNFKRTCITCDNVLNADCSDPRFKMVPAADCKREDDLCYSQHTPFGIIVRGCININHDLTIFVCACNLCNYLSITETPFVFSNKRDWIENVIELSRARQLRESIFKDMSCLRCEVNVTAKRRDVVTDGYCLEGNIAMLPRKVCAANEICAVKAIRSEGYMWRGCVSEPLYNYWWTFCDEDWCNSDAIVSVYDIFIDIP